MPDQWNLSWDDYGSYCEALANKIKHKIPDYKERILYGIPRGGRILADILSYKLDIFSHPYNPFEYSIYNSIFIDDIIDTGNTIKKYIHKWDNEVKVVSMFLNKSSAYKPDVYLIFNEENKWINFPYDGQVDTISEVKKRE